MREGGRGKGRVPLTGHAGDAEDVRGGGWEGLEHVGWAVGVDDRDARLVVGRRADPDDRRTLLILHLLQAPLVVLKTTLTPV